MNPPLMLTYRGETKSIKEWSCIVGIPRTTIWNRIKIQNFSVELALETIPLTPKKKSDWVMAVDGAVEAVQLMMYARGYFIKSNRIRRYKMLNAFYKEFQAEDKKAA